MTGPPPSAPARLDDDEAAVRLAVYRVFARTGEAPSHAELAAATGLGAQDVAGVLQRLEALHALVVDREDGSVAMAHPFATRATDFVVRTSRTRYFANCAWDALAMAGTLGEDVEVEARCAASGAALPMAVEADGGGVRGPGADAFVHLSVPFRRFWADVFFT